jgi:hypothetical protein
MRDEMKEALNEMLVELMGKYDASNLDAGFTQHLVDQMCDAVEVVYDTAVKLHMFLMGSK